jgi:heme/copper-type cytochrome/quinol oxidase subunit 2
MMVRPSDEYASTAKSGRRKAALRLPLYWSALACGALIIAFLPLDQVGAKAQSRTFRVEAGQYAYSPGDVRVNPGDTVTIELVSTDVVHGLYVDGYDLEVTGDPGQTARLTFVADRAGSFRLRCNVTCGAMHPFMIGKLHVGRNEMLMRGGGMLFLAALAVALFPGSKDSRLRRAEG